MDLNARRLFRYARGDKEKRQRFSWLRHRRERTERIEAEADALIDSFGRAAYCEARWREQTASCNFMADEWSRVALAVARKTGEHVGTHTATRMEMDADVTADPEVGETRPSSPRSDVAY